MLQPGTLAKHLDDQGTFMDVLFGQAPAITQSNAVFVRDPADERVILAGPDGNVKVRLHLVVAVDPCTAAPANLAWSIETSENSNCKVPGKFCQACARARHAAACCAPAIYIQHSCAVNDLAYGGVSKWQDTV